MQQPTTPIPDQYRVVLNHEEQYSLLPGYIDNPAGWRDAGFAGEREACLEYIGQHWTDMRPLSLRRHMEAQAETATAAASMAKPAKGAAKPAKGAAKPTKAAAKPSATASATGKPAAKAAGKGA